MVLPADCRYWVQNHPSTILDALRRGDEHQAQALWDDNNRQLEDRLNNPDCMGGSGGKRFSTRVVAAAGSLSTTPSEYDYVCTGANDQITINLALHDLLASGGGQVLLMEGTYNLTDHLTVDVQHTTLRGMGDSTVLRVADGTGNCTVVDVLRSDCSLLDLRIDGNSAGQAGGSTVMGVACTSLSPANFFAHNVNLTGCNAFGFSFSVPNARVQNCRFDGLAGVFGGTDLIVENCVFQNNAGVHVTGGRAVISGNRFYGNSDVVVGIAINIEGCEANVTGNIITGSYSDGVYLFEADRTLVTANDISGMFQSTDASTGNGIVVQDTNDWIVDGNLLHDNDYAGIMVYGGGSYGQIVDNRVYQNSQLSDLAIANIYIRQASQDIWVANNKCRKGNDANTPAKRPTYGLDIAAASNGPIFVINNDFHDGGGTGAYHDVGTGTVFNLDGSANVWNRT